MRNEGEGMGKIGEISLSNCFKLKLNTSRKDGVCDKWRLHDSASPEQ